MFESFEEQLCILQHASVSMFAERVYRRYITVALRELCLGRKSVSKQLTDKGLLSLTSPYREGCLCGLLKGTLI